MNDEPYYPIGTAKDREVLKKYLENAEQLKNLYFGGRLGSYKYLDMHQAVGAAMSAFEKVIEPMLLGQNDGVKAT